MAELGALIDDFQAKCLEVSNRWAELKLKGTTVTPAEILGNFWSSQNFQPKFLNHTAVNVYLGGIGILGGVGLVLAPPVGAFILATLGVPAALVKRSIVQRDESMRFNSELLSYELPKMQNDISEVFELAGATSLAIQRDHGGKGMDAQEAALSQIETTLLKFIHETGCLEQRDRLGAIDSEYLSSGVKSDSLSRMLDKTLETISEARLPFDSTSSQGGGRNLGIDFKRIQTSDPSDLGRQ